MPFSDVFPESTALLVNILNVDSSRLLRIDVPPVATSYLNASLMDEMGDSAP